VKNPLVIMGGKPIDSGMSFSTPEEFALWINASEGSESSEQGEANEADETHERSPPPPPTAMGRIRDALEAISPVSSRSRAQSSVYSRDGRASRSPSEYSMAALSTTDVEDGRGDGGDIPPKDSRRNSSRDSSLEPKRGPSSEIQVYLCTEEGDMIARVMQQGAVHTQVRYLLEIEPEFKLMIVSDGKPVEDEETFDNIRMRHGGKLHVDVVPVEISGTILAKGTGSLGLSIHIMHEADTGVTKGIKLGEVSGPAEEAGFMVEDILRVVDGIDVQKKSLQEVQAIFADVVAEKSKDPEKWAGLSLTVQRRWIPPDYDSETGSETGSTNSEHSGMSGRSGGNIPVFGNVRGS